MPEGPEVAFLARHLTRELRGAQVTAATIRGGRYKKHGPPEDWALLEEALPLTAKGVTSHGKVLFFSWTSARGEDTVWVSKLGMTGWWYVRAGAVTTATQGHLPAPATPFAKHDDLVFTLDDGRLLIYADTWKYGTLQVAVGPAAATALETREREKLAPDALHATWTAFKERAQGLTAAKRRWALEDLLMDQQSLIAGVGNYLKSEILYHARLAPTRCLGDLGDEELRALYQQMHRVTAACARDLERFGDANHEDWRIDRNTTFEGPAVPTGGRYRLAVYQRDVDPEGRTVLRRKNKSGRTTFWVAEVQI